MTGEVVRLQTVRHHRLTQEGRALVPADAHVTYSTIDDFVAGRSGLPCTFTPARKINAHEGATLFMRKLSASSLTPGFASELRAFYADDYRLLEAHGGSTPVSSS